MKDSAKFYRLSTIYWNAIFLMLATLTVIGRINEAIGI